MHHRQRRPCSVLQKTTYGCVLTRLRYYAEDIDRQRVIDKAPLNKMYPKDVCRVRHQGCALVILQHRSSQGICRTGMALKRALTHGTHMAKP